MYFLLFMKFSLIASRGQMGVVWIDEFADENKAIEFEPIFPKAFKQKW